VKHLLCCYGNVVKLSSQLLNHKTCKLQQIKQLFTHTTLVTILLAMVNLSAQTADDLDQKNYGQQTTDLSVLQLVNSNPQNNARTAPAAPVANRDNLCASGMTANLTATASAGGTLDWYSVVTGGTSIGSGVAYSPTVGGTTNYWVEEVVSVVGGSSIMSTPFNSNNGQRGCMFDLIATNTVTIDQFESPKNGRNNRANYLFRNSCRFF
jgi:hypothetical protein